MLVVAVLLCLGIMNMAVRASWTEMDDGVLWRATASDLVAREVAEDSPAARAGVRAGDILLQVDGIPVTSPDDVVKALHAASRGSVLTYSLLRMQGSDPIVMNSNRNFDDGKVPPWQRNHASSSNRPLRM